ncbi:MAG: RdgB/HAM1 family non-canonical purine NTP pyrophosphatase [Rhodobacteraceae bacterium]|nr:RdgB/HAM1 family non-canonical purine NTP pyrophosphatase [Paracoccaceae bacterium]
MTVRKLDSNEVVLASHNKNKIREFQNILTPYGFILQPIGNLNLPQPLETEDTFVGNAKIKAHAAAQATGLPAISDDSGLVVEALDGQPGVHTADWAQTPHGRDYTVAMKQVWNLLEEKHAPFPRVAQFCSTICLAWPDGHDEIFTGIVDGQIVWPMRGSIGFGFDPVFKPNGYTITFGEMEPAIKNTISHRALSLQQFCDTCLNA